MSISVWRNCGSLRLFQWLCWINASIFHWFQAFYMSTQVGHHIFFFGDRKILIFPNSAHPIHSGITNDLYHVQKAMIQLYISSLNLLWDCSTIEKPLFSCSARLQYLNSLYSDGQGLFIRWRAAQLLGKHASSPGQVLRAYVQRDSPIVGHVHFPCEGKFRKDRPHF